VLPRIATQNRADGVRLSAALLTRRELLGFWFLLLFVVAMLVLIVMVAANAARMIEGVVSILLTSGFLFESGRRFLRQRRLRSASLLVPEWPLRLGQRTTVRFEKQLKDGAVAERLHAKLTCTEEIVASSGRDQKKRNAIRYQTELDTSRARIRSGRITDEWEIAIPADGVPSFSVTSNAIRWRVETIAETAGVDVAADFELLVVPEVDR
jgi:hypothetical protein